MKHGPDVYQELLQKHGTTVHALGIPNDIVHSERLTTAADLIKGITHLRPRLSILDYGCGFADLYPHVKWHTWYYGYDANQTMQAEASLRYPKIARYITNPGAMNVRFDIVACLGVLSTTHPLELPGLLSKLWRLSERYLIVSWIADTTPYQGSFHMHAFADVIGDKHCRAVRCSHGETVVLLERRV